MDHYIILSTLHKNNCLAISLIILLKSGRRMPWWGVQRRCVRKRCEGVKLAGTERRHVHGVWLQRKEQVLYGRYKREINLKRGVCVTKVSPDER